MGYSFLNTIIGLTFVIWKDDANATDNGLIQREVSTYAVSFIYSFIVHIFRYDYKKIGLKYFTKDWVGNIYISDVSAYYIL